MADIRRGVGEDLPRGGERLPWLEPVEDEYDPEPGGYGGLAWIGIALLVLIGVGVGATIYYKKWNAGRAEQGQIIHAPPGPYKEKPKDPGGLAFDANGAVAEHTGTGGDIDAPLNLSALPEKPITGPGSEPDSTEPIQPAAAPPPAAAKPAVPGQAAPIVTKPAPPPPPPVAPKPEPAAAPTGGGGMIQLGALNSEAKAKAVWKAMSGRFAFLAPLTMSITPVKVGETTLYRLRAGGGDARNICAKLRVAGEVCTVVSG
jgi:hypothetical protein